MTDKEALDLLIEMANGFLSHKDDINGQLYTRMTKAYNLLNELIESNQSIIKMWEQGRLKIVGNDKQTNRQWLSSLTDEELANYLVYGLLHCDAETRHTYCDGDCVNCEIKWLKQEHKETENDK